MPAIELPLARPARIAGIKTSAIIHVGTATIAAFIGAGGYGEPIAAGLAVNDKLMPLAGAVPAAIMALLVQGMFDLIDRWAESLSGHCRYTKRELSNPRSEAELRAKFFELGHTGWSKDLTRRLLHDLKDLERIADLRA